MRADQIIQVCLWYEEALRRTRVKPEEVDKDLTPPGMEKAAKHIMWMLPKIREMVETSAGNESRVRKAERWLCFAQGIMWQAGYFSINEMREHNDSEKYDVKKAEYDANLAAQEKSDVDDQTP
jgi:hypothetical protein